MHGDLATAVHGTELVILLTALAITLILTGVCAVLYIRLALTNGRAAQDQDIH